VRARTILDNWGEWLPKFRKVMPVEYRRALAEMKAQESAQPRFGRAAE
jgi:glutamate synthase (NADPH/NADH) large chain